jgi:outer membrane protein OmpA-like peptidoglycan-associated protein
VQQQRTILNFLDGKVVEFEVGRDRLTAAGIRVLDRLVPIINAHEDTVITVQGHTDDIGDDRSNLELSAARAIVARRYLISQGISPERLRAQGLGERKPRATNLTEAGRIRNRRIDFAVSDIRDPRAR